MKAYIARRLLYAAFVLLGVSIIVFFLVRLTGDPAGLMMPLDATAEDVARMRRALGFDRPLPIQYADFLIRAVQGDFGTSIRHQQPAMGMVLGRLPATLQLMGMALFVALIIAVPLGILSALYPNSFIDRFGVVMALVGQAVPNFFLGIVLILFFSVQMNLLPSSGRGGIEHLLLPAVTLGTASAAFINRLLRSSLREVLGTDYIRTARAKGRSRREIVFHHALRNAAIPVVTVIGLQIVQLVGGAIVTETVFAYPGAGLLLVQSLGNRDIPVIQAFVLLIAVVVIVVNLVIDLLYGWLDPRISLT
ncbi:MAG: ABC transporter permease [Trueperaceae bacterium]|nr:ABC transporter permease [Trueperaceae bacterium]